MMAAYLLAVPGGNRPLLLHLQEPVFLQYNTVNCEKEEFRRQLQNKLLPGRDIYKLERLNS